MIIDENNIRSSVIKLSLPSVAEQTLMMVVGVVSTIIVGWISKEAISAVGLINTLINFIMVLFVALSTGCTVLVARLMGEEEYVTAGEVMKQSVVLGFAASVIVSVLCYVTSKQMIELFFHSAEKEVILLSVLYLKITLYTFPLTLLNILVSGSLRGAGDTKTPMLIASIVNIINIVLSVWFVMGLHTGMAGAAWAVAISRGVGGILSIAVLLVPSSAIRTDILGKFTMKFDLLKRMLKVGFPAALEQIVMQGGFLVLQIVIAGMGTTAIAVYQIGMSINSIAFIPGWGFGIAATTLLGQSLGARKPMLAEKSGWETLKLSMFVTLALTVIIFIFSGPLVSIYNNDAEVVKTGAVAIRIFSVSQPFLTVVVVFSGALRGAGDIFYVMISSFVGIWVFRVVLSYVLGYTLGMGIMGVWLALCADFLIRSIMYFIRFKRGRWKDIVI